MNRESGVHRQKTMLAETYYPEYSRALSIYLLLHGIEAEEQSKGIGLVSGYLDDPYPLYYVMVPENELDKATKLLKRFKFDDSTIKAKSRKKKPSDIRITRILSFSFALFFGVLSGLFIVYSKPYAVAGILAIGGLFFLIVGIIIERKTKTQNFRGKIAPLEGPLDSEKGVRGS